MRGQFFLAAVLLVALVAAPGVRARAAERVTLSNGFVQVCNHHAQVEGRIRLYTTTREDSYIDFAPEEIVSVETVPDPPQPPSSATEAGTTPAGTTGATDA